jgi:nicotinamidase-related amidase
MSTPGLLDSARCALMLVDLQARLLPALQGRDSLIRRVRLLLEAAVRLDVPVLATEQYPRGLGRTAPEVADVLPPDAMVLEKTAFSLLREPGAADRVAAVGRDTLVVAGAEAHVCVLQTAVQLREAGYRVAVCADAVASRRDADRATALARLHDLGVSQVTAEMVVFEWLQRADTAAFRALAPAIRAE